jgi:hypothetical protein
MSAHATHQPRTQAQHTNAPAHATRQTFERVGCREVGGQRKQCAAWAGRGGGRAGGAVCLCHRAQAHTPTHRALRPIVVATQSRRHTTPTARLHATSHTHTHIDTDTRIPSAPMSPIAACSMTRRCATSSRASTTSLAVPDMVTGLHVRTRVTAHPRSTHSCAHNNTKKTEIRNKLVLVSRSPTIESYLLLSHHIHTRDTAQTTSHQLATTLESTHTANSESLRFDALHATDQHTATSAHTHTHHSR